MTLPQWDWVCHFSEQEFTERRGQPCFNWKGRPVHPQFAQQSGFALEKQMQLPEEIKSRVQLSKWIDDLGYKSGDPSRAEIYMKYAEDLPYGELKF